MGKLTQGATYIYERDGSRIYARETGSNQRKLIGMDYPCEREKAVEWNQIREAARTNPALQNAVDSVIMLYHLSKETA